MEKTMMGLVAAIGAAAPLASAHASAVTTDEALRALQVASVAELLEPVANPQAVLAALASAPSDRTAQAQKNVEVAQYYHHHHHHWYHHHHHHHWYHHHHHHYYYHHHHHHYRPCFYSPLGYVCP